MSANSGDVKVTRVRGDFNGLFRGGTLLCLSHTDTGIDENGNEVVLYSGLKVTAFDEDLDEKGKRDDLIASGVVEKAPDWLQCRGSGWALMIDENGVRHESELEERR